jgi:hypothetical protein
MLGVMGECARFVTAALRGRKRLFAAPFTAVVASSLLLLALLPRNYHVEARLLAEPDPVLSALSNPGNAVPREDPARFASHVVHKRSNLERIVGEARLMETWAASRGPLMGLKDHIGEALGRRPSPEDLRDALVDLLDKKLSVRAEDAAVVIAVDWPERETARAIVDGALRTFLEERRVTEVAGAEESIAILDRHLAEIDQTMGASLVPVSLEFAAAEHDRLSRRLWDARIELDGVRVGFDRRYAVLEPARTPRQAQSPRAAEVLLAAALAGLLLGVFAAAAAEARAGHTSRDGWAPRGLFVAILAALTLATIGAVVVGGGRLPVAVAPVLAAAVIYGLWRAPVRASALVMLFLILALENPGDAGGRWQSPLAPLGGLLLANLNLSLPVRALRFTGLDVLMGLLIVVILTRRAVRAGVDRGEARPARPMAWAAVLWFGTVLALWAYGLARGGDFRNSLWQCHQLLWVPLAYFVFQSALRSTRDYGALARVVVAAACVKACLALWVRLTVSASADVLPTATSHGDSILFACAFALVVALVVEEALPGRAVAAGLVLALLAAGMVANNRRLAWVEVAAALLAVYANATATRLKRTVRRTALLAMPLLVLYGVVGWTSSSRVFAPARIMRSLTAARTDWSTAMRDIENFNLLWTLRDHPLVGTGFGHEYVEKVKAVDISNIFPQYRYVPHNSVLGLLAFGGAAGLTGIFLTLAVGVFLAARAHRFARTPADRAAALVVIVAVIVYLVQAYGDMGLVSWTGTFLLAPARAVASRLAPATGAWPAPVSAGR